MKSYHSLEVLQKDLLAGEITCLEVVENSLSLIKGKEDLNAFLEVFSEQSLEKARLIDTKIAAEKHGKLAGLCIGVKDLLSIKDQQVQASSKILEGYNSAYSATAIERLIGEDAIILGRNGCDEFGMGSTGETSVGGPAKNPIDTSRVPGGSSSGSAVAVAAGMCQVAIGTDTGGSVRQPASFCGIIGLKPTYSRISRFGLIAYASSFDTIGILGRSIHDIARTLQAMAGPDEKDSTVSTRDVPEYSSYKNLQSGKKKVGYFNQALDHPALDPEIKDSALSTIEKLKNEGYEVDAIDFPLLDYVLPTYYILTAAEAGSNLSRFDGVRYGYRSKKDRDLNDMIRSTRSEGFGEEVIRRIMLGTFVLSASYYDAYFTKAQKVRRLIRDQMSNIFRDYEYIITPTSPVAPYKIGELEDNPLEMYLGDLYTVIASVAGIPAISLPVGNDKRGLPIGLQVMSKEFSELKLLSFSNYILSLNDRNHPI